MITVRHIERLWSNKTWGKLIRELLCSRPENSLRLESELHSLVAAAAMAMIRLDELNQTHAPLFSKLLKTLIVSQEADGGWRDAATTAICLRALMIDRGQGMVIDGGLKYLASLQQPEGGWPKVPIRRMPADGFTSALVLFHLTGSPAFSTAVRLEDAIEWFHRHADEMDAETSRLWSLARLRCRSTPTGARGANLWS
jgi:hypothetical protein